MRCFKHNRSMVIVSYEMITLAAMWEMTVCVCGRES